MADKWQEGEELIPSVGPGGRALTGRLRERKAAAGKGATPTETLLKSLNANTQLAMLMGDNPPTTDMSPPLSCANVATARWVPYYKNKLDRRIRMQLFTDWKVAGSGIKMSRQNLSPDDDILDIMTESGTFGKNESKWFILKPGQTLYVRPWQDDAPTLAAMATVIAPGPSIIRGRIADPGSILSD